jgi:hypothetical protein
MLPSIPEVNRKYLLETATARTSLETSVQQSPETSVRTSLENFLHLSPRIISALRLERRAPSGTYCAPSALVLEVIGGGRDVFEGPMARTSLYVGGLGHRPRPPRHGPSAFGQSQCARAFNNVRAHSERRRFPGTLRVCQRALGQCLRARRHCQKSVGHCLGVL